ncbi:MAG: hypothetical protein ACR2QM_19725, partial [Longimicrobiales bacterium]
FLPPQVGGLGVGGWGDPLGLWATGAPLHPGCPSAPAASALVDAVRARFGESVLGVLLYGSCLHKGDLHEGLADLYVIVDRYRDAYPSRLVRALGAALPPNVHYLEAGDPLVRAKVAVVSIRTFEKGTDRWFHPYLWARFAQPVRLLFAADPPTEERLHRALSRAVLRFHEACLPAMAEADPDAESIWRNGLRLTYASELRAESNRGAELIRLNLPDYERLSALALPALMVGPASKRPRRTALLAWWLRRQQGRVLSVLRLSKALFTFENGVDYLAWKIERHSGVPVEITPRLRRYPLLWGPKVLWRLVRRGAVR